MAYNGYGTGDNFEFCISTYYWGGWLPVSPYCLGGGSGGGQDLNGDGVMDSYSGIAIGDKLNDDDTEFYFTFGDLTSPTLTVHNYYVEPPEPTLVWMDNDMFYEVSSDDYALVDLPFKLVAYDYSGSENFDVYVKKYLGEIDELAADELVLENVVGTFGNLDGDSNTDKYASVTLTEEMLDGDETEFYFKVGNYESSILTVSDLSGTCEDGVCDEGELKVVPKIVIHVTITANANRG